MAAVLVEFEVLSTVQAEGCVSGGWHFYLCGRDSKENFQKGERKKSQVSDDFDEEMEPVFCSRKKYKIAVLVSLNPEEYVNILLYREETDRKRRRRRMSVSIGM